MGMPNLSAVHPIVHAERPWFILCLHVGLGGCEPVPPCRPSPGGLMRRLICGAIIAAAVFSVSPSAFAGTQLVPSYFYPTGTPNPWKVMCDSMGNAGSR